MTLTLVDLSGGYVRGIEESGEAGWIKVGGPTDRRAPRSQRRRHAGKPAGRHLTLSDESAKQRFDVKETSATKVAAHMSELVEAAERAKPGTTEHEHAWGKVAAHLEVLNAKAKTAAKPQLSKVQTGVAKPVKKASKRAVEVGEVYGTTLGAVALVGAAVAVADKASSLLGPEKAEAFHHLLSTLHHSLLVESAVIVAITLAVHALIAAIRKALTKRRDAKIEKARLAVKA